MQTQIAENIEARRQPSYEAPSLYTLAREELTRNGNDADAAEDALIERLSTDAQLLRALVRGAVRTAVSVSVATVIGNQRAAVFESVNRDRAKAQAKAFVSGVKSVLLDMPLADGTRLRDATATEIAEAADRYEKNSKTMAHRARWLRAILTVLPPGRRCGDVVTEKQAEKLFRDAA